MQQVVTIRANIDATVFRNFALFDTFRLKKHWLRPVVFALIMLVFALICFFSGKEQSVLLGVVLSVVGLGMPIVYVASYLLQIQGQIKKLQLKKARVFYTLTLSKDITIHNDQKVEQDVTLPWDKVFGIWRGKDAFYLYVSPVQAFLLPDASCPMEPMALWQWLGTHLPVEKLHGKTLPTGKNEKTT